VVASEGGLVVREAERAGARHVTLPLSNQGLLATRRLGKLLADVIRSHRVTLVHVRAGEPAASVRVAATLHRVPMVSTFHDGGGTIGRRQARSLLAADRIIAGSAHAAKALQQDHGVAPDKIVTIPRGIDLGRFDPARVSSERVITLAREWRLPDGLPVALLPGRLIADKGHIVFVDALAQLPADVIGVVLAPPGGASRYREQILKLAQSRGLGGRLRLIENCRDVPAAYMLADVVVMPSIKPATSSRVLAEAQAMGRPVIASAHGAAVEIVLDGQTGWLVAPGDVNSLATVMKAAFGLDLATRQAVAETARAHVRQNFDVDLMCARTLALYETLVRPPARAALSAR
jgi:glycosyltransferase involved in cell wall biosynthesis